MRGNQIEGQINTDFEKDNEVIFSKLKENEAGELTYDELGKFIYELLKNQVKALRQKLEDQKYDRALEKQESAAVL